MNGVIWNKVQKIFVPISSIPAYAMMQQKRFEQNRALENHNFQLQNLTLTSFEESSFLEFYDNDTKVTGLYGELWTLLSESLNFTLQPVRSNENSLGTLEENNTYEHGLLGILFRNETIAIPKVEVYSLRLVATDFTIPLWINSYRTYIRREEVQYNDITWMAKVFSWKVWCIILIMHVILSICGFWSQIILTRIENKKQNHKLRRTFLYNFGMLCNQNYIPEVLDGRSKILEISLGLFCSILYMAFNALLFIYITKSIIIPPFDNLPSLITQTTYNVVSLEGSMADIAFKKSSNEDFMKVRTTKRIVIASTVEEMLEMVCLSKKKYAAFQGQDTYKTSKNICPITPIGKRYLKLWIASGIVKNFKYKRTIDLGILKLMEVGLWDALKDHWLERKFQDNSNIKIMDAVGMDQVVLVNAVMCCGAIVAFIILIIEKIVYTYKLKQS